MILIGYSGHAFVAYGIFNVSGIKVIGYCDKEQKSNNPFLLDYYGSEVSQTGLSVLQKNDFFIAIGDNNARAAVYHNLKEKKLLPVNAVHPSAIIDSSATIAVNGVMIGANVTVNSLAKIATGVICNTGCIIEHECMVNEFSHIAPGAVLCGNVTIGSQTFIGANSVIRQGVTIGNNAIVGAGSVVLKDIPDNMLVFGNPAKMYPQS